MFIKEGPVFLLIVCQGLKKTISEKVLSVRAFSIEQVSISEVDQLPGIVLIEVFGKIPILYPFDPWNLPEVCRDMVEPGGFMKDGKGILVHFPVKGGEPLGDEAHGLEPARSRCF